MNKRVFFGFEVFAPWPDDLPEGRIIQPKDRHLTLAFLGNVSEHKIEDVTSTLPKPEFLLAPAGKFSESLFLPSDKESVVAWEVDFLDEKKQISSYVAVLQKHLEIEEAGFLPHVSMARRPFDKKTWQDAFMPLPFICGNLYLYESIGNLEYTPIWRYPMQIPIVELEHTADRAFIVHGESPEELYKNAQLALSCVDPRFLDYFDFSKVEPYSEDLVRKLNGQLAKMDSEIGCLCKAVSYHGEVYHNGLFSWEMIIDV